jgi:hypothetical protein
VPWDARAVILKGAKLGSVRVARDFGDGTQRGDHDSSGPSWNVGLPPGPIDIGGCHTTSQHRRHDIGSWLRYSYERRKREVITAYLVIRQTYSRISVEMLFDRSRSVSMNGDLAVEDGRWTLYYTFRSDKQTLERDENPPARGAAQLTVGLVPSTHLEGDYWMEHGTRGQVATVGHTRVAYETYQAAEAGTYS